MVLCPEGAAGLSPGFNPGNYYPPKNKKNIKYIKLHRSGKILGVIL